MEVLWILLIVVVAGICAIMVGKQEMKREGVMMLEEMKEQAVRFSEECYMEGIIPIQKVKQMAVFYLAQESKGRIGKREAERNVTEVLEQSLRCQQKKG